MSANRVPVCPDCGKQLYLVAKSIFVPLNTNLVVAGTCLACEAVFSASYTFIPIEESDIGNGDTVH